MPEVVLVQQPAVAREHVALDPPLMEEQLVAPELFSAQGGHVQAAEEGRFRSPSFRADGAPNSKHGQGKEPETAGRRSLESAVG